MKRWHPLPYYRWCQAKRGQTYIRRQTLNNTHKFVFHLGQSYAVTPKEPDRKRLLDDIDKWAISLRKSYIYSKVLKPIQSDEQPAETAIKLSTKQMERDLGAIPAQNNKMSNSGNHALELFLNNVKNIIL